MTAPDFTHQRDEAVRVIADRLARDEHELGTVVRSNESHCVLSSWLDFDIAAERVVSVFRPVGELPGSRCGLFMLEHQVGDLEAEASDEPVHGLADSSVEGGVGAGALSPVPGPDEPEERPERPDPTRVTGPTGGVAPSPTFNAQPWREVLLEQIYDLTFEVSSPLWRGWRQHLFNRHHVKSLRELSTADLEKALDSAVTFADMRRHAG